MRPITSFTKTPFPHNWSPNPTSYQPTEPSYKHLQDGHSYTYKQRSLRQFCANRLNLYWSGFCYLTHQIDIVRHPTVNNRSQGLHEIFMDSPLLAFALLDSDSFRITSGFPSPWANSTTISGGMMSLRTLWFLGKRDNLFSVLSCFSAIGFSRKTCAPSQSFQGEFCVVIRWY